MKFAVAVHGTRGDVEPCAAVALELLRRGHQVRLAVPPNLIPFVAGVGFSPVAPYGVDSQKQLDAAVFRNYWKVRNPVTALRELREYMTEGWEQMSSTLATLADDADLILTGTTYQEVAANVAEYHRVPLAALHYFPFRSNSYGIPLPLPALLTTSLMTFFEWGYWRVIKDAEDAQRRELGLPAATTGSVGRIVGSGALEIQAYDEVFFPGLAAQWEHRRPLVGFITLQLGTAADADVAAWIAADRKPIYFGFGSMPVQAPAETVAMIADVCADLGERALVCAGAWNLDGVAVPDHVKIVDAVSHAAVFPECRAVVHHGGAGTTAAGLRAGVPTSILWIGADQPCWAAGVRRLGVGDSQRFARMTHQSLRATLRSVLTPGYSNRARDVATRLVAPDRSVSTTADLLEEAVRRRGILAR